MWLYILLTLAGMLLTAIGVLGVLGSRLPETHVATASMELGATPEVVWATINEMESFPAWVPGFTKMERLPDDQGKQVWRQHPERSHATGCRSGWSTSRPSCTNSSRRCSRPRCRHPSAPG